MIGPARRAAVVAVAGLLLPLSACTEDDAFASYCTVVADEQDALAAALAENEGAGGLLPALPVFERLAAAAPDDIADDWSVIVQRLTALADALDAAGVDPEDYDVADPPVGVTDEQQEAIALGASSVATPAVRMALENVEQQSRDVCKTELNP